MLNCLLVKIHFALMVMAKLLFVDDEQFILSGMERIFRFMAAELDVVFTSSSQEAVDMLKTDNFDVVISDMYMPDINGVELLSKAKELQPETIRIMLSGILENSLDAHQRKVAHLTLHKPINAAKFIDTVRKCIAHKEQIVR